MPRFDNYPVDDLRLFKEQFEDGDIHYLVYSYGRDALTPVGMEELEELRQRGVQEIDELPE